MSTTTIPLAQRVYPPKLRLVLRLVQVVGLVILAAILVGLVVQPALALKALWFAFIPLAPMVLLVAPNFWVSVCPVSTLQVLPRRVRAARPRQLSAGLTRSLQAVGWAAMFLGIPTRHLGLNVNGPALLLAVGAAAAVCLAFGQAANGLSGWCVGACPVRPIEVVYGQFALDLNRPEKCTSCNGCVASCQRARPERSASELDRLPLARHLCFGLPGFIAGYFALDFFGLCQEEGRFLVQGLAAGIPGWSQVGVVYGVVGLGWALSYGLFRSLEAGGVSRPVLYRALAVASYVLYYVGVVPEIVQIWQLPIGAMAVLGVVPAAVLAVALWRRPSLHKRAPSEV